MLAPEALRAVISVPRTGNLCAALFTRKILFVFYKCHCMRDKGIEPLPQPWEGRVLPLNHTRKTECRERDLVTSFASRTRDPASQPKAGPAFNSPPAKT